MTNVLVSYSHQLLGHALPTLLALQDAPRPSGGAPASPEAAAPSGGLFSSPLMPLLLMGAMFLLILLPASRQKKAQEKLQSGLQKGDRIVTTSGMIGTISGLDKAFVTVEISERVRVKFLREAVSRKIEEKEEKGEDSAEKKDKK